jgi:peptidase E
VRVSGGRHIVGIGGGGDSVEQSERMHEYVLGIVAKERPKMLFVPTAAADNDAYVVWFYERLAGRAELSHLKTFPWPPEDLRNLILSQDAICVSGGNTANMLAIWRVHGIDQLMREAWESGIVLWGASAGMICWFEHGVTDSFGPGLDSVECLGFLPASSWRSSPAAPAPPPTASAGTARNGSSHGRSERLEIAGGVVGLHRDPEDPRPAGVDHRHLDPVPFA